MIAREILGLLVDYGAAALTKPHQLGFDAVGLEALRQQAKTEHDKAAPDGRLIHDEDLMLAQALTMAARAQGGTLDALLQVIGVLLPIARKHFAAAIEATRRAATTDQDYAHRGGRT